ncbi:MAG: peptidylprolyl isomerase [Gammaproteobacteria bacterium]|jgi:peptidyl-prolyl cis-trans isomerase C|nr:peptidylprolyl isomerase [Gammaproteobacteria bacterium]
MTFSLCAGFSSARRVAAVAGAIVVALSSQTWAQAEGGVSIDPNVFNMYLESRTQKPADQASPQEVAAVRDELTDIYLLSELPRAEELKDSPRIQAQLELQSRAMLAQAVAADFLADNQATEEEMQALYAEEAGRAPAAEFKARHILVETQGEATAVIAELDGGASFEELARTKSTGPSGPSGGDLGWFSPESMVPEFSQAVMSLANGEYTEAPVQTQFGWHVILREDSREAAAPPYDSVRDALKQQVESQKFQAYLLSLRESPAE